MAKGAEDGRGTEKRRGSAGVVWRVASAGARPAVESIDRAAGADVRGLPDARSPLRLSRIRRRPAAVRPRTLCFDCFRMEITWRQDVAARMARGWNAEQAQLPLEATFSALARRRRRAQIAARHALGDL